MYLGLKMLFSALFCMPYVVEGTATGNISRLILAYENAVCRTCNSSRKTHSPLIKNGSIIYDSQSCKVCETCKCDPNCRLFGDCCIDIHIGKGKFDFHCHRLSNDDGFLIVSTCTEDAANYSKDFGRKCNNFDKLDLIESRFVSSRYDGTYVTFRNKYCAFCHGYKDLMKWNYKISCEELPDNIADVTDPNDIFPSLMKSTSCFLNQTLDIYTRRCRPSQFATRCNITGHWREYNAEFETSCHAYYNPTIVGYTNIFCQLCNYNYITSTASCRGSTPMDFASITGLLTFEEDDEVENPKCKSGYFWDILTEQCLRILCPPFHRLQNSECLQTIHIKSLLYIMNITLFPYANESVHIGNLSNVRIMSLSNLSGIILKFYTNQTRASDWKVYKFACRYYGVHLKGSNISVIEKVDIVLFTAINNSNSFAGFTADVSSLQFGDVKIVYKGKEYNFHSRFTSTTGINSDLIFLGYFHPFRRNVQALGLNINRLTFSPKYIRRNCAQILYQESQYVATHNNSILLVQSNILIPDSLTTRSVNNSLLVCISTIQTLSELYSVSSNGRKDNSVLSEAKAGQEPLTILTVVCLSISLFCLVLTFSVYSVLSELRTIPGYNLMFLITWLFLAQGVLLLGGGAMRYAIACTVIGVFLHYLWLVTFAWMIVCTFHAFRVFRNVISSINQYTNTWMVMLKYSLFSYLTPGIIIIVTIVTNYFISNTSSIGYADGKNVCFVNPGMASILAFGVPVLFTILVTGFCFIYTVVSVRRASSDRVDAGKNARGILFTVLKLSTITSLSWLFGLLGSVLSFQPFQFVFVILAAGQGLFIFFAFVVNRRVLELCKRRFKPTPSTEGDALRRVTYTTSSGEVGSVSPPPEK